LYRAILELHKKDSPIDPVTIAEWLQIHKQLDTIGGGPYLAMLASNISSTANT